eukprot:1035145-Prymnesium_polylepis.1
MAARGGACRNRCCWEQRPCRMSPRFDAISTRFRFRTGRSIIKDQSTGAKRPDWLRVTRELLKRSIPLSS